MARGGARPSRIPTPANKGRLGSGDAAQQQPKPARAAPSPSSRRLCNAASARTPPAPASNSATRSPPPSRALVHDTPTACTPTAGAPSLHAEPASVRAVVRHARTRLDVSESWIGDVATDADAAVWLAREGRFEDAFALAWRVLASEPTEGTARVLRLFEECEPRAALAALPLAQTCAVAKLVVAELHEERHVAALLPWLERALWLHHQGTPLFDDRTWAMACKAVRGLSASEDAVGIAAARLLAFLHPSAKKALSPERRRPAWQETHSWLD